MSPRWGYRGEDICVSTDIPPRWGCAFLCLRSFFISCCFVKNSEKNTERFETQFACNTNCPNFSKIIDKTDRSTYHFFFPLESVAVSNQRSISIASRAHSYGRTGLSSFRVFCRISAESRDIGVFSYRGGARILNDRNSIISEDYGKAEK